MLYTDLGKLQIFKNDLCFKFWAERGISKVMDTYNDNVLLYSFDDLKTIYNIPGKHFFKYLQIRSYILTALKQSPLRPLWSSLEKAVLDHLKRCGQVSLIYKILVHESKESSDKSRLAWYRGLDVEIAEDEWERVCLDVQTQTINTRYKLLQFKWIMRVLFFLIIIIIICLYFIFSSIIGLCVVRFENSITIFLKINKTNSLNQLVKRCPDCSEITQDRVNWLMQMHEQSKRDRSSQGTFRSLIANRWL